MTIDKIDISKLPEDSPLRELVIKLNCKTNYDEDTPKDSIMHYGQLCNHDNGILCEHRLQYILNTINKL